MLAVDGVYTTPYTVHTRPAAERALGDGGRLRSVLIGSPGAAVQTGTRVNLPLSCAMTRRAALPALGGFIPDHPHRRTSGPDDRRELLHPPQPRRRKTISDRTSHWPVLWCPAGSGHALFMQGELTDGKVHIYSDDISVARWLQRTIETLLHPPFADEGVAVLPAVFTREGE